MRMIRKWIVSLGNVVGELRKGKRERERERERKTKRKKIEKSANFLTFLSSSSRWIQMNIARCIAR